MTPRAPGPADTRSIPTSAEVLDQLQAAVVVTDAGGNLLYANPFAVRLFGFPDEAVHLVGRSLASLGFEEGDAPRVNDLVTHVVRGRPWEGTFACRRMDGSRLLVRARASALHDPSGEIVGIAIMGRAATMRGSTKIGSVSGRSSIGRPGRTRDMLAVKVAHSSSWRPVA